MGKPEEASEAEARTPEENEGSKKWGSLRHSTTGGKRTCTPDPKRHGQNLCSPASFSADTLSPFRMRRPQQKDYSSLLWPVQNSKPVFFFFSLLEIRVLVVIDLSERHYSITMKNLCSGVKHETASAQSGVG